MWRLVSRARRRLGRLICRFTWHNSTPDSGTIALEAPSTSLSPAEVIFPSLGGNNSKWAGLPAKGLRKATTSTKVIDLNNVCTRHLLHLFFFSYSYGSQAQIKSVLWIWNDIVLTMYCTVYIHMCLNKNSSINCMNNNYVSLLGNSHQFPNIVKLNCFT